MDERQTVKFFVSSPGDVGLERAIVSRVLERLQGEFLTNLKIESLFWEHEAVRATSDYQSQFPRASAYDVVVCILWSRLGTRLPDTCGCKPDGSPWRSGTEFEFVDAYRSYCDKKRPDLLVFRKTAETMVSLSDDRELQNRREQKLALDQFLTEWFYGPNAVIKNAFTPFTDDVEFERTVYIHLRNLLARKLSLGPGDSLGRSWTKGSPFRGLASFEAEHAAVFHGRTRATFAVRDRLVQQAAGGTAFLLLVGASGSGKSSLLGAGVVPHLTHPRIVEKVDSWRVARLKPSDAGDAADPCEVLATALESERALPELRELEIVRCELLESMQCSSLEFKNSIQSAFESAAEHEKERESLPQAPALRLLVVVDQFEEIFTTPRFDDAARGRFIRALAALAKSGHVWVIAAVRSDFYHRCLEIPELADLKGERGQYELLPPTSDELRRIIVEPAFAAGLEFEVSPQGERLDAVLLEAAVRNPGTLPLLEFALDELYELAKDKTPRRLTRKDYDAIGGLEGALARHAEDALCRLPKAKSAIENQNAFNDVMSMAVSVSPQGRAALPIDLRLFKEGTPARELIDALVEARLMTVDSRSDGSITVRLAHDTLLTHWEKLEVWVAENEELLRIRGRVESSWQYWLDSKREPSYLLADGKPLTDGKVLLDKLQSRLDPDLVGFVKESVALDLSRRRARRRRVAAVTALFMALVAGAGIWIARAMAAKEATKRLAGNLLQGYGRASAGIIRQVVPVAGVDPDAALEYSAELTRMFDEVTREFSETADLHAQLAELLNTRARIHAAQADVAKAEELSRRADGEFALAPQDGAESRRWRLARGRNLANLCSALLNQHDFVEAGKVADEMLALAETWRGSYPDDPEFRNLRCDARRWKGLVSFGIGDALQAGDFYRRTIEELREAAAPLSDKDPRRFSDAERETLRLLAQTLWNQAFAAITINWGSNAAPKRWSEEALKFAERLKASAPGDGEAALLLANARLMYQNRIQEERPDEGRRLLEQVLQDSTIYCGLNPTHGEWNRSRIESAFLLGDLVARGASATDEIKRLREGIPRLRQDLKRADEIREKHRTNRTWDTVCAFLRRNLGDYYSRIARLDADPENGRKLAEEADRLRELDARALLERLEETPDDWSVLMELLATTEPRRFDLWIDYHRRRLAVEPDNPAWTAGVAYGLVNRTSEDRDPGRFQQNDSDLREASRLYDSLAERLPGELQWASRAANAVYARYGLVTSLINHEASSGSTSPEMDRRKLDAASLLQEGLRRYQDLATTAAGWKEHHDTLFEIRGVMVRNAWARNAWAEAEAAMKSALNGLDKYYATVPDAISLMARVPATGWSRALAEQVGRTATNYLRSLISAEWLLTHARGLDHPKERQTSLCLRINGILSLFNVVPRILGAPTLDGEEARAALRLARAYLDELEGMNYKHPVLDVWRKTIKATLASLPREPRTVPSELQKAWDRMDYRGVVGGWLDRGGDARDVLAWLDSEARLARQASWLRPSLWTLLFLPAESARKLLNAEALDSMRLGPAPHPLAPETLALLQGVAGMQGDFEGYSAVSEHGESSGDPLAILLAWIDGAAAKAPAPGEQPAFGSRGDLNSAAQLVASVDVATLGADVATRVRRLKATLDVAGKIKGRLEVTDDDWKKLEAIRNDQTAPAGTRAGAARLRAEDLLLGGEYVEAREILQSLLERSPDGRPILTDLVLLDLLERESAAPEDRGFPPLADLRIRLLQSRYPGDPFQRLLTAWWGARYRGVKDALEKAREVAQLPGYAEHWLTHDLLAHVAEAAGDREAAKTSLKTALEKIPEREGSRRRRERLEARLNLLEQPR